MTTINDSRFTIHWIELALLLAVAVPFLFWGIGSYSFLDPDEGMWGSIALEMARGGDWIIPHFNGLPYPEKPPLFFWLSAATFSLFAPAEWGVRIWSSISALGTVLLIWRMGDWLYGPGAGILSALVLATSVGMYHYAHVPFADMLFLFCLTLCFFGFMHGVLRGQGRRTDYCLFYLGAALGVLAKGLIGLAFPVLIVGLFALCSRRFDLLSSMNLKYGILLFLAVTLPWHVLVAWQHPDLLGFYFFNNHFLRFMNARGFAEDDVQLTALSYLIMFLIWFFPWTLSLPAVWRNFISLPRRGAPPRETLSFLLALWVLVILVFFSLSLWRLEHYSLPALPAVSLLVGGCWAQALRSSRANSTSSSAGGVALKWSLGVGAIGCTLFGLGLLLYTNFLSSADLLWLFSPVNGYYRIVQSQGFDFPSSVPPFASLLRSLGWVLAAGPLLSWALFIGGKVRTSFSVKVAVAAAIGLLVFKTYLLVEPHRSVIYVARSARIQANPKAPIVHEGLLEHSAGLVFYTGRQIHIFNGKGGDLEFGGRQPEAQHLFFDRERFLQLWHGEQRVFLVTRYPPDRSVVGDLPRDRSFLVGRYGLRWLYTNRPGSEDSSKATAMGAS